MTATCYGCPRPAGKDGSAPCICNLPITTDRRDADDATFAAELARLDRLEVADVAADAREQADALLSRTHAHMAWRGSRGGSLLSEDFAFLAGWDAARTAMFAELSAPGTDSSGQAVQRVLDWPELIRRTEDGGWDGGWTWTECIHCGSAEVVERGLILEDGPAGALRRVAWCDRPSCASDEMLTDYLPTPRATSDFLRAVAGPQRDHDEEGACAPDCDERADCPDVSSAGHSQCGRRPDGTPRHHPQRDHDEEGQPAAVRKPIAPPSAPFTAPRPDNYRPYA